VVVATTAAMIVIVATCLSSFLQHRRGRLGATIPHVFCCGLLLLLFFFFVVVFVVVFFVVPPFSSKKIQCYEPPEILRQHMVVKWRITQKSSENH
jgi:hypothetical protein